MNTKKHSQNIKEKSIINIQKRLDEAKKSYQKFLEELTPFIPDRDIEDITTEGQWQNTNDICYSQ